MLRLESAYTESERERKRLMEMVSALSGRRARGNVAMTGEISLRGKVLPVGGIKGKLLAAARAGVQTVLLPRRNEKDLSEIPPEVLEKLEVRLIDRVQEGYVTDFIHFRWYDLSFFVNNVADCLISMGVVGFLITLLRERKAKRQELETKG